MKLNLKITNLRIAEKGTKVQNQSNGQTFELEKDVFTIEATGNRGNLVLTITGVQKPSELVLGKEISITL